MIRVAVTEDERALPVGRVPAHDADVVPPGRLGHEPLRHVDPMMDQGGEIAPGREEPAERRDRDEGGLEIAPQHRPRVRLTLQVAAPVEAQGAG